MAQGVVIALLRGINVGKANRVGMADLRAALEQAGYEGPRTLLQSGNVVVRGTPARVAKDVAAAVEAVAGFTPPVVTRSLPQLRAALQADPFAEHVTDPTRMVVGFLDGAPAAGAKDAVAALGVGDERIALLGREIHAWCPDGLLQASWARTPWDKLVGRTVTTRNQATLGKLVELAQGM